MRLNRAGLWTCAAVYSLVLQGQGCHHQSSCVLRALCDSAPLMSLSYHDLHRRAVSLCHHEGDGTASLQAGHCVEIPSQRTAGRLGCRSEIGTVTRSCVAARYWVLAANVTTTSLRSRWRRLSRISGSARLWLTVTTASSGSETVALRVLQDLVCSGVRYSVVKRRLAPTSCYPLQPRSTAISPLDLKFWSSSQISYNRAYPQELPPLRVTESR